ncbi:sulfite exporter TauE/SafE family protein [Streptomyces sp. INR7]|uniref:sulfite exporter TauE/SafE family protein n=1 Tax=Streptomyces sp. INR7 TaxID=2607753 RepID=UPI001629CCA0|nr:sulfite exporter TauE/SafE family protein [Streptomyces sp. INR7]QNE24101.1 sulfite exporter TauE/SafE family protein [Streptomyces sp. INR7]
MSSTLSLLLSGAGTGLLAGGASCAAVQGGLLAGAVSRRTPAHPGSAPRQTAEPLAPVGAFLIGKLLSHTGLGFLLGIFGAALQPSPRTRAVLLIAAGLLMVFFALDLLGIKAVSRLVPRPPAAFGRLVRGRTKSSSRLAPAALGFATVLIPCGVTLSVELIAVTTGSAVSGAAVMAGFVIGTAPLFTLIGYAFRRASQNVSSYLAGVTGIIVAAIAVWTISSGLQAGGWLPTATTASAVGSAPAAAPPSLQAAPEIGEPQEPVTVDASGKQTIILTVTDFYVPTAFTAKANLPTTLVLRGADAGGCARAFTIPELGIEEIVKKNGDTRIDLGTRKPGKLLFSCAMGMQGGVIDFQGGHV